MAETSERLMNFGLGFPGPTVDLQSVSSVSASSSIYWHQCNKNVIPFLVQRTLSERNITSGVVAFYLLFYHAVFIL